MALDALSMVPLVEELRQSILGGRIDKIFQPNKYTVLITIRQSGKQHTLCISIASQNSSAYLMERNMENPLTPPVFCMVLRKQLEMGRIGDIHQREIDRIIFIDIDCIASGGKIVTKTLALELMGKYSNIILISDGKIVDAMRKIGENNSRVRTVLPGTPYELPPVQRKSNPLTQPVTDILTSLKEKKEERLDKAIIATCSGAGPYTAKEICFLAGLNVSARIGTLGENDFESISHAIETVRAAILAAPPRPILLLDDNKKILAMASFPLHYLPAAASLSFHSVSSMLEKADNLLGSYVLPDKERFKKFIRNELSRARNKLDKLEEEIETAENANSYKVKGDNLQTYQYAYSDRKNSFITVPDIYSTTGKQITIELDQRHTLIENMQAYYKKYDKLKRAQILLQNQKDECLSSIRYLESIESSLYASESLAEIAEIQKELINSGYLHEKQKKNSSAIPSRPFQFSAPDGTVILIGKNNMQNDRLTFKAARPNDTWFHTKDIPGSHVIVQNGGAPLAEETIRMAAGLAAHFSKARDSSQVPVDYTKVRYVKKPAHSRPGFVIFTNQATVYVNPIEPQEANNFLKSQPMT